MENKGYEIIAQLQKRIDKFDEELRELRSKVSVLEINVNVTNERVQSMRELLERIDNNVSTLTAEIHKVQSNKDNFFASLGKEFVKYAVVGGLVSYLFLQLIGG